jgi:hypothetical protein
MNSKIKLLLIACLFPLFSAYAQSEEEKIKTIIQNFNSDISKLLEKGGAQADQLLGYVNTNFRYERHVVNIFNNYTMEVLDYKTIVFALNEMRSSNVTNKRTNNKIENINIVNNLAFARYSTDYELYESDRLINKGSQYVDLILRKSPTGQWKIESMVITNIDDITYKSTCICEIYETQGQKNIISQTILPDGSEADMVEDKFYIDESMDPRQVRYGFKDYLWASGGAIYKRKMDGSNGEQVGTANSRQELILALLKKEIYPDRCDNVIRKLK